LRHDSDKLFRPSARRGELLAARADLMRSAPTAAEARLFGALRGGRLGVSFRRQVPLLGRFIADVYASHLRLVVEVDGGCHAQRAVADERRTRALTRAGYTVFRVQNELVMRDLDAVLESLRREIARLRR